jgi:hypothetical protein
MRMAGRYVNIATEIDRICQPFIGDARVGCFNYNEKLL